MPCFVVSESSLTDGSQTLKESNRQNSLSETREARVGLAPFAEGVGDISKLKKLLPQHKALLDQIDAMGDSVQKSKAIRDFTVNATRQYV